MTIIPSGVGDPAQNWTTAQLTVSVTFSETPASTPDPPTPPRHPRGPATSQDNRAAGANAKPSQESSESVPQASSDDLTSTVEDHEAQAILIGANLVTFVEEIAPRVRRDVVHALWSARLSADRKVPWSRSLTDAVEWSEVFVEHLQGLGFLAVQSEVPPFELPDEFRIFDLMLAVGRNLLPSQDRRGFVVWSDALNLLESMPASAASRRVFSDNGHLGSSLLVQTTPAGLDDPKTLRLVNLAFAIEPGTAVADVLSTKLDRERARLDLRCRLLTIDLDELARTREATEHLLAQNRSQAEQYIQPLIDTRKLEYM